MRVVVAGSIAQRPGRGGHTWVFLQYLLGFAAIGCDVLFVDRLEPDMCVGDDGDPSPVERSKNLRYLIEVLERFGLSDRFAVLVDGGRRCIGMERSALVSWVRSCDLFVDVMGFVGCDDVRAAAPRTVFLDIDPGFTQMWCELGLHDPFGKHDAYATFGVNIGHPGCTVPTCGIDWIPTRPPVVLSQWPAVASTTRRVTSVCTWRGPYAAVEHGGVSYGLRAHRLRELGSLPMTSAVPLELALDIDAGDHRDLLLLKNNGWQIVDPLRVAGDPESYRRYVQGSAAELTAAKDMYVRSRSGWFSDRSACYLASGKPVVAQDTGFGDDYAVGKGLVAFSDEAGAARALEDVFDDYPGHARAARAVAEATFASDRVLGELLDAVFAP